MSFSTKQLRSDHVAIQEQVKSKAYVMNLK